MNAHKSLFQFIVVIAQRAEYLLSIGNFCDDFAHLACLH